MKPKKKTTSNKGRKLSHLHGEEKFYIIKYKNNHKFKE